MLLYFKTVLVKQDWMRQIYYLIQQWVRSRQELSKENSEEVAVVFRSSSSMEIMLLVALKKAIRYLKSSRALLTSKNVCFKVRVNDGYEVSSIQVGGHPTLKTLGSKLFFVFDCLMELSKDFSYSVFFATTL
mmetsp:Transcript_25563/g.38165  ORF Transcript_25563/g.38165 Transcript_25563/m.38165 type:complete len:132 (+) Transcript_25563:538-933(+)